MSAPRGERREIQTKQTSSSWLKLAFAQRISCYHWIQRERFFASQLKGRKKTMRNAAKSAAAQNDQKHTPKKLAYL